MAHCGQRREAQQHRRARFGAGAPLARYSSEIAPSLPQPRLEVMPPLGPTRFWLSALVAGWLVGGAAGWRRGWMAARLDGWLAAQRGGGWSVRQSRYSHAASQSVDRSRRAALDESRHQRRNYQPGCGQPKAQVRDTVAEYREQHHQ